MRTLIIGNSYFGKKITKLLNSKTNDKFFYVSNGTSLINNIRYILLLFICNQVYSISGTNAPGKSLKLAYLLRKRIIQHFIGSDVLDACNAHSKGKDSPNFIKYSTTLCEVSWIQEELKTIGISSKICPLFYTTSSNTPPSPFPQQFTVLTYVGKDKEDFYGLQTILEAAIKLPYIKFIISGSTPVVPKLENIQVVGWVNNLSDYIKGAHVYLRIPKHDGLAFTLLESLSHGRYVITNNNFPATIFASSTNEIISNL